jgi:ABC-type multidrug transport system ATPase subunit
VSSNETVVIAAAPREDRGRRGSATAGTATVELRAAHVRGSRGPVFGPLTATSRSLVTVGLGPRGSGRTSLLLSIAGRMQLSGGSLSTMGATSPAEIRRLTGLVGFEAVDALEPAVTLGATLRERLSWALPWYRRTPRITPQLARELLADAFGDLEQPGPALLVRDLSPSEEMLVRVSLALIETPRLLVVDDFDALRDPADRALVAERLSDLAQQGIRIVLASSDPGDAALLERALPAGAAPALIEL